MDVFTGYRNVRQALAFGGSPFVCQRTRASSIDLVIIEEPKRIGWIQASQEGVIVWPDRNKAIHARADGRTIGRPMPEWQAWRAARVWPARRAMPPRRAAIPWFPACGAA